MEWPDGTRYEVRLCNCHRVCLRTLLNCYTAPVRAALLKALAALARVSGVMICRMVGGCLLCLLVKSMTALSRYNYPPPPRHFIF
jgi:hypothetical protein